jgi:hypothetical protein
MAQYFNTARIDYDNGALTSRQYLVKCNGRLLAVIRYLWQKIHLTVTIEVYALEPDSS